jgi:hypothetical protein
MRKGQTAGVDPRLLLPHQLRQPRDIRRDPPRLVLWARRWRGDLRACYVEAGVRGSSCSQEGNMTITRIFLLRWRAGAGYPNRNQCFQLCRATLLQVGRRQIHQLEDRQTG